MKLAYAKQDGSHAPYVRVEKQEQKSEPHASLAKEGWVQLKRKWSLTELNEKAELLGFTAGHCFKEKHSYEVLDDGAVVAWLKDGTKFVFEKKLADNTRKRLVDLVGMMVETS